VSPGAPPKMPSGIKRMLSGGFSVMIEARAD
jgi:hypothetical protein